MLLFAIFLGFLPGLLWLAYFYRKDHLKPEPFHMIRRAYFLGMLCVLPAIFLEVLARKNQFVLIMVAAPLIEEVLKFLAVLCFIYWKKDFDEVMDGIFYAATVALGFASLENAFYLIKAQVNGDLGLVFILRALLSVPAHALLSSFWGCPLGLRKFKLCGRSSVLGGLWVAVFFHAVFNFTALNMGVGLIFLLFMGWLWKVIGDKMKMALLEDMKNPLLEGKEKERAS